LKQAHEELISTLVFNFHLRRYAEADAVDAEAAVEDMAMDMAKLRQELTLIHFHSST